jgi:hypothetical protein
MALEGEKKGNRLLCLKYEWMDDRPLVGAVHSETALRLRHWTIMSQKRAILQLKKHPSDVPGFGRWTLTEMNPDAEFIELDTIGGRVPAE